MLLRRIGSMCEFATADSQATCGSCSSLSFASLKLVCDLFIFEVLKGCMASSICIMTPAPIIWWRSCPRVHVPHSTIWGWCRIKVPKSSDILISGIMKERQAESSKAAKNTSWNKPWPNQMSQHCWTHILAPHYWVIKKLKPMFVWIRAIPVAVSLKAPTPLSLQCLGPHGWKAEVLWSWSLGDSKFGKLAENTKIYKTTLVTH